MEMQTKEIQVPISVEEFGQSIVKVLDSIQEQLKDGYQPFTDIPAILVPAISELAGKVYNLQQTAEDVKAAPIASARSIANNVFDAVEKMLD